MTLYTGNDWDFDKLREAWEAIDKIAKEKYNLDYYEPQIEIVSAEQMLDAYSSHGLPSLYKHWSFGKSFIKNEQRYKAGQTHLAYELIINTNPAIAYLMESNSMTMQALTLAHAVVGHSAFFKTNYLFKDWTDADSIIDYLVFSKNYIAECEKRYGPQEVEQLLDAAHALQDYGVDQYKRRGKLKQELVDKKHTDWVEYLQQLDHTLWDSKKEKQEALNALEHLKENERSLPEENLLYFLEKYSPILKPWQREILRIVRNIAQYFYPQMQTKIMNEGWACYWHHTLMTDLHEQGLIEDGHYIEFIHSHCGVCNQPKWNSPYFGGINPYVIGYKMFKDIERIIEAPTEEDTSWFPEIAGQKENKLAIMKDIAANYRDESFILQFLSPKLIRDLRLFVLLDDEGEGHYEVTQTHEEPDTLEVRKYFAAQVNREHYIPRIEIISVNERTKRLVVAHTVVDGVFLDRASAISTMEYLSDLWGYFVELQFWDQKGNKIENPEWEKS